MRNNFPDINHKLEFRIITNYPEMFPGALNFSLIGKALKNGLWDFKTINLRDFGEGNHKKIDDPPAGGGGGMILKPNVVSSAILSTCKDLDLKNKKNPLIYLTPKGKQFNQKYAYKLAKKKVITIICGKFGGIDDRIFQKYNIKEISMGDFIMNGGEVACQSMIETVVRLLPGVIGNKNSFNNESFSNGLLEHPKYTSPKNWSGFEIPKIIISGDHEKIKKWEFLNQIKITKKRRPDLWKKFKKKNLQMLIKMREND